MMEDVVARLNDLTDVDLECVSIVSEQAQLHSMLTRFMENEAKSCSMDFGCITPLYVYRMWGGAVSINEIERAMNIVSMVCE